VVGVGGTGAHSTGEQDSSEVEIRGNILGCSAGVGGDYRESGWWRPALGARRRVDVGELRGLGVCEWGQVKNEGMRRIRNVTCGTGAVQSDGGEGWVPATCSRKVSFSSRAWIRPFTESLPRRGASLIPDSCRLGGRGPVGAWWTSAGVSEEFVTLTCNGTN